ncbi:hypothetical protein BD309DRAFT_1012352 [Dichomitus squalens]|nr:hypothetical protein BD309DRAFT_1012352 [Dichomitus squalens]
MGLSGRKTKQRIPNDPRNLAWANDANKFGAAYLAKFGWDPSGGLGVSGEGRTKALSVHQKLDMLGIGADHKNSAEGLAWKQNKDFENLLRRLNAANGSAESEESPMKIDGFTKGASMTTVEAESGAIASGEGQAEAGPDEEKRPKKKRKKDADGEEGESRKKKHKKSRSSGDTSDSESSSKKQKKSKKRDREGAASPLETETFTAPSPVPASRAGSTVPSRHPRAAFRARHMAAKSRASTSATALAEILGIADSGSVTPVVLPSLLATPVPSTPFTPGPSTSSSDPSGAATPADGLKLQELTVSSKSVMDYFKEKLAAKSRPSSSAGTPASETGDYDDRPRMGLGASGLRAEVTKEVKVEERRGLGGIGSGMRTSFASMFTSATVTPSPDAAAEPETEVEVEVEEPPKSKDKGDKDKKKEKTEKKSKKGKERAKEKASGDVEETDDAEGADQKAERKRRKEERRRRKEAEAAASGTVTVSDGEETLSREKKERRQSKGKKSKKER